MATSLVCPSCKQPFGLPPSFTGGRATCPNPQCGKTFFAPGPEPAAASPAGGAVPLRSRSLPARPAAESHIPPNIYASPAFVAGGGVVVLLYGLVLFAVLSGQKRDAAEVDDEPPPLVVAIHEPKLPLTNPSAPPPSTAAPKHEPPKPDAAAPKAPFKPQAPAKGAAKPKGKASSPEVASKTMPPPVPSQGASPSAPPRPKPKTDAPKPKPDPRANPSALALNTAAPSAPGSVEGPTFPRLSPWVDPAQKVKPRRDADAIVLVVPPGIHILSPELKRKDAPMSLVEVTGDFEIQVRVAGGIRPGSQPVAGVPLPIAFQGAGLLIWQDQDNYLRFERAAMSGPNQPLTQKVLVEPCRENRLGGFVYKDTSDRPVNLRITRKGDDLECAYSPDGATWIVVKKSAIAIFPDKVRVGIAASNLSPKPFTPRFDAFSLETPSSKIGSH